MSGPVRLEIPCDCPQRALIFTRAATAAELPSPLVCRACGKERSVHREHVTADGGLTGCLACGHIELYRAKTFPRAVGVAIVVVAAILAPFTFYLSLVLAAVIDLVLYLLVPDMLVCYVCATRHLGFAAEPKHPRFDREVEERLKYGEKAVMGRPMRAGGTAGAPEPEH